MKTQLHRKYSQIHCASIGWLNYTLKGFTNIFLWMLMLGFTKVANSQPILAESLQQQFMQRQKEPAGEKLFLHSDKTAYVAGETIWFKIYCVNAHAHRPIDISKVAYVEILDAENKPVLQGKIELQEGLGNGSFYLPFNIATGNYTLRAYTAWMKNFDADLYFHQSLTIVNTTQQPNWSKLATATTYDFQLLPEGGHLVQNIESKIAFRLVDNHGKGVPAHGVIITEQQDTLVQFQSSRFGLGTFLLEPLPGQAYKAVVTSKDGAQITKALPPIQEKGYVMHVSAKGDHTNIRVIGTQTADSIYVVAHCRQSVLAFKAASFGNGQAEFEIPNSTLKDGINHFTILNSSLQPVCERLYFKTPTAVLNIVASANAPVYKKRGKVNVDIETYDGQLQTSAHLSLSVRPVDSISAQNTNHLLSYLLLTSELKGTIEEPAYYLMNKGPAVDSAIDHLMLVHGWSRFNWDNIFKKQPPIYFLPEYEGPLINAILKNKQTGKVVEQVPVYFSVPEGPALLDYGFSDLRGKLVFRAPHLAGNHPIIFQSGNQDDSLYNLTVENPFSENEADFIIPRFLVSQNNKKELTQLHTSTLVQNLYLTNQANDQKTRFNVARPFYGKPDKSYRLEDYTRFTTMEEVLREYVAEVRVKKNARSVELSVYNSPYQLFFSQNPLVLLDGAPVFNMEQILKLNPATIRQVDVVARKYFYGAAVFNGIVNFNSNKENLQNWKAFAPELLFSYEGLQLKKDFFSPVYEQPSQIQSRLPDYRNVLYWLPEVQTKVKGKLPIHFYTSDLPGDYLIEIQGLDKNGKAGYTVLKIKVE